jgi:hypothetical protein
VHWIWKLLIALVGLFILGAAAVILAVYIALPSPAQLHEKMFSSVLKVAASKSPAPGPSPTTGTEQTPAATPAPSDEAAARAKVEENERLFTAFLDNSRPMSRACDSLRSIKYPQTGKIEAKEFGKRFAGTFGDERNDPRFESLVPVLKFTLTRPKMREIVERVRTAKPQSMMEEFRTKKDFYFLVADAFKEMNANRVAMQDILDQSYLTMMLGRAVEMKPTLANDSNVMDFCLAIESRLNREEHADFAAEKKIFEEFLTANAIDPKAIDYDPAYKTNLQIVFNENGLHFSGGWTDRVFGDLAKPEPTKAMTDAEAGATTNN